MGCPGASPRGSPRRARPEERPRPGAPGRSAAPPGGTGRAPPASRVRRPGLLWRRPRDRPAPGPGARPARAVPGPPAAARGAGTRTPLTRKEGIPRAARGTGRKGAGVSVKGRGEGTGEVPRSLTRRGEIPGQPAGRDGAGASVQGPGGKKPGRRGSEIARDCTLGTSPPGHFPAPHALGWRRRRCRVSPAGSAASPRWGRRAPRARGGHARLPLAVTSRPARGSPLQSAGASRGCGAVSVRSSAPRAAAASRCGGRQAPPPPSLPPSLVPAPPLCPMFGLGKPAGQQEPGRSGGLPKMASVGDFNVLSSSIPATKVELSVSCRYGGGSRPRRPLAPRRRRGRTGGRPSSRACQRSGQEKAARDALRTPGAVRGALAPALGACGARAAASASSGRAGRSPGPAASPLQPAGRAPGVSAAAAAGGPGAERRFPRRLRALPRRAAAAAAPHPARAAAGSGSRVGERAGRVIRQVFDFWSCPKCRGGDGDRSNPVLASSRLPCKTSEYGHVVSLRHVLP